MGGNLRDLIYLEMLSELQAVLQWAVEEKAPLRETEISSLRAVILKANDAK